MKIAMLGASNTGKTVYFSSLFLKHRDMIGIPELDAQQRARYREFNVHHHAVFRMSIDDIETDAVLRANASLLLEKPIQWPEATYKLGKSEIKAEFDFMPLPPTMGDGFVLADGGEDKRSYERRISIYDPPGGAFVGVHMKSDEILRQIATCDVAIAFISADTLLDEVEDDTVDEDVVARVLFKSSLGKITETLRAISKGLGQSDIFPVCFALSKYDLIPPEKDAQIKNLFYDYIIKPFSRNNPQVIVCGCPISVLNSVNNRFRSANVEWPFLFAAGGTILRNSFKLRDQSRSDRAGASIHNAKAAALQQLYQGSFWDGLLYAYNWTLTRESFSGERNIAQQYENRAKEKSDFAEDDIALALDIWSSIAVEQKERGIRIYKAGERFDPREGVK